MEHLVAYATLNIPLPIPTGVYSISNDLGSVSIVISAEKPTNESFLVKIWMTFEEDFDWHKHFPKITAQLSTASSLSSETKTEVDYQLWNEMKLQYQDEDTKTVLHFLFRFLRVIQIVGYQEWLQPSAHHLLDLRFTRSTKGSQHGHIAILDKAMGKPPKEWITDSIWDEYNQKHFHMCSPLEVRKIKIYLRKNLPLPKPEILYVKAKNALDKGNHWESTPLAVQALELRLKDYIKALRKVHGPFYLGALSKLYNLKSLDMDNPSVRDSLIIFDRKKVRKYEGFASTLSLCHEAVTVRNVHIHDGIQDQKKYRDQKGRKIKINRHEARRRVNAIHKMLRYIQQEIPLITPTDIPKKK